MKLPTWLDRFRRGDPDLDEEIRAHLEEKIDALIASGMTRADATAATRRAFGNAAVIAEHSRDVWRLAWFDALASDVKHSLRLLTRYHVFSANVIFIAAIGIAACTTTFSLVSGVLLSPLPFAHASRVYSLEFHSPDEAHNTAAVAIDSYRIIESDSSIIESISAGFPSGATVRWGDRPDRVRVQNVTSSFFHVYGVAPILGRQFTSDEADHDAPVAILGYPLWQSQFNGDSSVIGKTIQLDNVVRTVVGIMPPGFRALYYREPEVWLPAHVATSSGPGSHGFVNAQLLVREGITAAHAQAWLASAVHERMESSTRSDSVNARAVLVPIHELVYGDVENPLRILLAAVLLVLVLVSANVATMFVARSSARDHELGIRRALGASTARQISQLVTESVVLVAIGGLLGIAVSYWMVAVARTLGDSIMPRIDAVHFNWQVALFALLATLATGILGGLPPALGTRRDLTGRATGARVTARRMSSSLVVAQISLSVVLLVGAGLLVKGFLRVLPSSPGFATNNRTILTVSLRDLDTVKTHVTSQTFIADVSARMRQLPTVHDVATMSFVPFSGMVFVNKIRLVGYPEPPKSLRAYQNVVTPNLHDVLEIPVVRGRKFTDRDDASSEQVAIVNETAAARWWPGENPIGKRVQLSDRGPGKTVTVIGEMSDARLIGADTKIRAELYVPAAQEAESFITFIVQTNGDGAALMAQLKKAVWGVTPDLPITDSGELSDLTLNSVGRPRFFAWVMSAFAIVAVVLSGIAVYGLLTLDVVQRRQEIGVRMALGASRHRIGVAVLLRAAVLGGIGVLIGAIAARALGRYMESLLVEVTATDGYVFAGTIALALFIAALAACAPAYRALRVDPAISLRVE